MRMGYASKVAPYGRKGIQSGAVTALSGTATLLRGFRSLRRGKRRRALAQLLVGGLFVGIAAVQRQSADRAADVDQTDVVSTAPDIDEVDPESDEGGSESDGDVADAVDTSVDIEEAGTAPELDTDVESTDVDQTDVVEPGIDEDAVADSAGESDVTDGSPTAVDEDASIGEREDSVE